MVGTGAAFGYRTFFGGPAVKAPPPVIRASAEPSKVAPPPQADSKDTNKITYDRFADRGQNEQIVPREEKPVDVREAARSGPPRAAAIGTANASNAPASTQATNPPSVLTEPKRVRTVPIRPDAPDTSAARPQMIAAAPRRRARARRPPMRRSIWRTRLRPVPRHRRCEPPRAPRPRTAARHRADVARPPDGGSAPPARAAAPSRVAAAPVAAAPAGNGNYLVQVSSQRSEADAQAAFRSVKSKYSGVLGDRQPVIRRADLAGKGTYYRAMVGPFATRNEAIQLCTSLKAAGGDCVVQAN